MSLYLYGSQKSNRNIRASWIYPWCHVDRIFCNCTISSNAVVAMKIFDCVARAIGYAVLIKINLIGTITR